MMMLTKRNLLVFFRDRASVFFSLLAVFLVIGLYALFLGDIWLQGEIGELEGGEYLMNSWLVSGLLAIASVTTTMGAFGTMIDDKAKKTDKDFYSSPVKRSTITAGYLSSALLIGIIMSLVTLVLAEFYIVINGGSLLSLEALIKVLLLIVLSSAANTALIGFMVSFFSSQNAFGTASTIIGTLIGFLTGVYLPIGNLPASVQTIIKLFPPSHSASLLRQVIMEDAFGICFDGAPAEIAANFKEFMGVTYAFGDKVVTPLASVLVLVIATAVFFGLSVLSFSRNSLKIRFFKNKKH